MAVTLLLYAVTAQQDESWLEKIGNWASHLMEILGGPGIAAGIFLENVFPPIPSELILPFAGFTAAQPNASFTVFTAIIWATLGSVVGAFLLYWIGRALGHDRMVWLFKKIPLTDSDDVTKTVSWFAKHGGKAVFFGRMLPIFRSLISIPAGIEKMSQLKFLLLTLGGSLIWNTIFIMAGYWLGDQWENILEYSSVLEKVVLVGIIALIVWWIIAKLRKRRRLRGTPESSSSP